MKSTIKSRTASRLSTTALMVMLVTSVIGCGGGGGGGGASTVADPSANTNSCAITSTTADSLVISEVSTNYGDSSGPWFEVFNASSQPVDLAQFKLRVRTTNSLGNISSAPDELSFPSQTLGANAYMVVASLNSAVPTPTTGQDVVYVDDGNGRFPHWSSSGFIEITKGGATVDAFRFGNNTDKTMTTCGWRGANSADLPSSASDFGKSAVRLLSNIRTNSRSAADWVLVPFSTPGGQNDVPADAVDADNDGIPDSAEVPGGTYAGINLYALGARSNRPDIFVQVDRMEAAASGTWVGKSLAWTPQKAAVDKVAEAFAKRGYALHVDVGDAFGEPLGTGSNMGYARKIPFSACSYFEPDKPVAGCDYALKYKPANMPAKLRNIFHYAIFGVSHSEPRFTGQAEVGGNDFAVLLGNQLGANLGSQTYVVNLQASTFMHELGHNLGLRHGGFEDRNYKPNYYSVMNYLYTILGLPKNAKGAGVMQRWNLQRGTAIPNSEIIDSPYSDSFTIDFSDGSSQQLDGRSLLESELIGRGADPGIYADWNSNGVMDLSRYAVSTSIATMPVSLDPDGASPMSDFNDWKNLNLPFSRRSVSRSTILSSSTDTFSPGTSHRAADSLINDRQEWANEAPAWSYPAKIR